jgi:transcriptional antiterminator NusG
MWYVAQVQTGMEHKMMNRCRSQIEESILEKCFVPMYEEKKKKEGRWNLTQKVLFPGYIFVITKDIDLLRTNLTRIDGFTHILGTGEEVVPLTEEEVYFIEKFTDDYDVMKMSEGIIENSKVIVQSGPLSGMEAYITKIDRHKRKAYLEIDMFGRKQQIEAGLEIFRKS